MNRLRPPSSLPMARLATVLPRIRHMDRLRNIRHPQRPSINTSSHSEDSHAGYKQNMMGDKNTYGLASSYPPNAEIACQRAPAVFVGSLYAKRVRDIFYNLERSNTVNKHASFVIIDLLTPKAFAHPNTVFVLHREVDRTCQKASAACVLPVRNGNMGIIW